MTITGWTWDYVRNSMTLKRYEALKKSWVQLPPLAITAFAIASAFGMEKKNAQTATDEPGDSVFYDESYYENTAATPWNEGAVDSLSKDFEMASGQVKTT